MQIAFVEPNWPNAGILAVPVHADRRLSAAARELDERSGGWLVRALDASPKYKGKPEEILSLVAPPGLGLSRVVLVGLGSPDGVTAATLQRAGGALAGHLQAIGETAASVRLDGAAPAIPQAQAAAEFGFGARLRTYRFDKYRTTQKPEQRLVLQKLIVQTAEPAAARTGFEPLAAIADGVFLTRDLVSEPANVLYPESFAERCRALEEVGVTVEILDEPALRKLGMGSLLGVGQGSARESRVVVMQWRGAPADQGPPVAFIGKGVTFDTGGISLKPGAGMEDMKWDMAGAGAVVGAMRALAGRKAKANVVGLIGLVENMPSGTAQRPGDVVTSMSGQTIEVLNTDAEGRLVLADVLWYAQDRFKPRCMVDLATLTGAIMVALGLEQAGLFSNDDELARRLQAAGEAVGEKVWRMPLGEAYDKEIDSDIADVKNIAGSRYAGSIIGAQFLQRFVNKQPWAHLDIAGVAWTKKDGPTVPKGASAFGVRLLDRLVADLCEAQA